MYNNIISPKINWRNIWKAATMSTVINSFNKTGVFPFNDNVFEDFDFMSAETTHTPITEMPPEPLNSPTILYHSTNISNINFDVNNVQPSCSNTPQMKHLLPKDVMPIPQRSNEENSIPKRKRKTVVLASSPYKNELESKTKNNEPENACIADMHNILNSMKAGFVVRYVRNGLIFHVLGRTMKETPYSLAKIVCISNNSEMRKF
ncbi:tigger transposable element-derived protein 6-like, partial [Aphis craccivora]